MKQTERKKCIFCRAEIRAEAKFCPKCGKNLTGAVQEEHTPKSKQWLVFAACGLAVLLIFFAGVGVAKWKTGQNSGNQGTASENIGSRAENAYMTFLQSGDYRYYALMDINGDDVPELFAAEETVRDEQEQNSLSTGYCVYFADIYGYEDGGIVNIYDDFGCNYSEIMYSEKSHAVLYYSGGRGWNQWRILSVDDSMFLECNYLSWNVDTDTYYYGSGTDDSCEISMDEYDRWKEKWDDCEKVPFQKFQPESNQDMYICVEESYESGDSGRYTYDYNRKGQRIKKTFASGSDWWVEYQYDDQGNLSQEETFCSGISEERIEYAYDTEEKLLQKTYFINGGSGLELDKWLEFEYDSNGDQVLEIQYSSDGEEYFRMSKEYDSDGNVIRAVYSYMDGDSETEECKYDSHGQLIECITWDADGNQMEHDKYSNEYDSHGNLIKSTVTEGYFYETTYKYQLLSEYLEEKD